MGIAVQVLGEPGRDNALLLQVHTGHSVARLLFDCGDGVLTGLPFAEIQRIDHLCFSHLHMDHIGGFDSFFRCTYDRTARPNAVWGPPGTARILHHRFQGFLWNLHEGKHVAWHVYDIDDTRITRTRFELAEAFAAAHPAGETARTDTIIDADAYTVAAIRMDHRTPSLAYVVREKPRLHIDHDALLALGVPPGPWVKQVKDPSPAQTEVEIAGVLHPLADLRAALLHETPGQCVAYLTDFALDADGRAHLLPHLLGCNVLVCESAYRACDHELAARHHHLTTVHAATLARDAGAGKLILIHLSDRYPPEERPDILREAQAVFPNTEFSRGWGIASHQ